MLYGLTQKWGDKSIDEKITFFEKMLESINKNVGGHMFEFVQEQRWQTVKRIEELKTEKLLTTTK